MGWIRDWLGSSYEQQQSSLLFQYLSKHAPVQFQVPEESACCSSNSFNVVGANKPLLIAAILAHLDDHAAGEAPALQSPQPDDSAFTPELWADDVLDMYSCCPRPWCCKQQPSAHHAPDEHYKEQEVDKQSEMEVFQHRFERLSEQHQQLEAACAQHKVQAAAQEEELASARQQLQDAQAANMSLQDQFEKYRRRSSSGGCDGLQLAVVVRPQPQRGGGANGAQADELAAAQEALAQAVASGLWFAQQLLTTQHNLQQSRAYTQYLEALGRQYGTLWVNSNSQLLETNELMTAELAAKKQQLEEVQAWLRDSETDLADCALQLHQSHQMVQQRCFAIEMDFKFTVLKLAENIDELVAERDELLTALAQQD